MYQAVLEGVFMPLFEVDTHLIVETSIRVTVEAANKEQALEMAAALLPMNADKGMPRGWSAKVELKVPKGMSVKPLKVVHLAQTSGAEKVRKAKIHP